MEPVNFTTFEQVFSLCHEKGNHEKQQLSSELSAAFHADLRNIMKLFQSRYDWDTPSGRTKMMREEHKFWEKFGVIVRCYPLELNTESLYENMMDFCSWRKLVRAAFCSGELPYPIYFIRTYDLQPREIAAFVHQYVWNTDVCDWIIDNWAECCLFKSEIVGAVKQRGTYYAPLAKKCQSHRGLKCLFLFLFVGILSYLFSQNGIFPFVATPLFLIFLLWGFSEICMYSNRKLLKNSYK